MKHQVRFTTLRLKTRITFFDLVKEVKKLFPVLSEKQNIS